MSQVLDMIATSIGRRCFVVLVCWTGGRHPSPDVASACGLLGGGRSSISLDELEQKVLAFKKKKGKVPSLDAADRNKKQLARSIKNAQVRYDWTPSWEQCADTMATENR